MLDPSATSIIGQMVPDYDLLKRIAGGAYGEVWLARSKATGALRAAKIVWRRTFEDDRPFQREFEGIQRYERISREHPSQLALFHIGRNETEGLFYYVMELADNAGSESDYSPRTLRAELENRRLPAASVVEIGLALCEALEHLHRNGLVHRDVKPSNVIFVNGKPKLADIGLVTDSRNNRSIVGTEGYLVADSLGKPQADIFALGKVLYEAATGLDRLQFPRLPEDLRSWPDAEQVFELNEIFLKACAGDARQRYAGAQAMLGDLQCLQRGKSVKRRRNLQWWWAAGKRAGIGFGIVAAVVIGVTGMVRGLAPWDPYPEGGPSTNLEANVYCDKAMQILRDDNYSQMGQAYSCFTNAISLDLRYARPYVGLLQMALREPLSSVDQEALLKQAAAKLHELAPKLGATSVADSIINYYGGDLLAAKNCGQKAIKANPNYELAHTWHAYMLAHWRQPVAAREELKRSEQLTPSKALVYVVLGHTYYAERDFTNAVKYYDLALKLSNRQQPPTLMWLGRAWRARGDYEKALAMDEEGMLLNSRNRATTTNFINGVRKALAEGGPLAYWQLAVTNGEKFSWRSYKKAVARIHIGDTNGALDLLEKSLRSNEPNGPERIINILLLDESWDGLEHNERFQKLLKDAGFLEVMARSNS